jgi:ketosteroid isomerase-like protein
MHALIQPARTLILSRCVAGASLLFGLVLIGLSAGCRTAVPASSSNASAEIRSVLEQQARDWNDGSIERFMRGYARADATRFASGGDVVRGWQTVFDRYVRKYGDRASMGTLTFSDMEITVLSGDAAMVFGHWRLQREKDEPSGLFTLVFRKLPEGWRIIHDHTSAPEKK